MKSPREWIHSHPWRTLFLAGAIVVIGLFAISASGLAKAQVFATVCLTDGPTIDPSTSAPFPCESPDSTLAIYSGGVQVGSVRAVEGAAYFGLESGEYELRAEVDGVEAVCPPVSMSLIGESYPSVYCFRSTPAK